MGTKVKGLFKGFKYISQIFEEPKKEDAFQIGMPTDVKHVAHIGWDNNGPGNDSPSWMKDFESNEGGHNSGTSVGGSSKRTVDEASNVVGDAAVIDFPKKPVVESPKKDRSRSTEFPKPKKDRSRSTEFPKKERSRNSAVTDSPQKEKSRSSRRRGSKSSLGSIKLNEEENVSFDTPPRDLPDIPKKARKKKPKDSSSTRTSKHRSLASASDRSHSNTENESSQAG